MSLVGFFLKPFIPWATQWVTEQEAIIFEKGQTLHALGIEDARRAGVSCPEKIRILTVPSITPPNHWLLSVLPDSLQFIGPQTAGLTLNYGIYIHEDYADYREHRELYVHEMVHVGQYERMGSIKAFLTDYLEESISPGYPLGPMEQEAVVVAARIVRRIES